MNNPNILHQKMGKRILQRRKTLGWSQEELAEAADLSSQLISTAERGTKAVRPENLLKISRALGVSADYLLTGEITNKDLNLISQKIDALSPEQVRTVEKIIDSCVELCNTSKNEG